MRRWTRRQFLQWAGLLAASAALLGSGCTAKPGGDEDSGRPAAPAPTGDQAYLAVARGSDPATITERALAAIGGIERFVKSGHDTTRRNSPPPPAPTWSPRWCGSAWAPARGGCA